MTNKADTFQLTYRDFYIEVNGSSYMATSYDPWHIIRATNLDELKKKIDDYVKNRD